MSMKKTELMKRYEITKRNDHGLCKNESSYFKYYNMKKSTKRNTTVVKRAQRQTVSCAGRNM